MTRFKQKNLLMWAIVSIGQLLIMACSGDLDIDSYGGPEETEADVTISVRGRTNGEPLSNVNLNVYEKPRGQEDFSLIYEGQTNEAGILVLEGVTVPNILQVEVDDTRFPGGSPLTTKVLGQKSAAIDMEVSTRWDRESVMNTDGWDVLGVSSYHQTTNPTQNIGANVLQNNTQIWHTNYAGGATPYPHWLIIDMKTERFVNGFGMTQRASNNGPIKRLEFHVSTDNEHWEKVIDTEIPLTNPGIWHTFQLESRVRARYIKFIATEPHIVANQFINVEQIGVY
ncbi:F5/8 type C domain-containing protein [Parapedobacter composti]|uniref:F5/8 type C domain-containing protein n=1 Tax=Parapedobacter composti TaxID=623281 RepID=A0A1I1HMW9_9SPHI|nr:discoidin domain-containing protein [Parapedobacter composti]SFC25304.1 F5/8 type C domain-containing protein [Parapedobacter composti]